MNDLGLDLEQVRNWFPHEQNEPYVLVRVSSEHAAAWAELLGLPVRRCYITDSLLQSSAADRNVSEREIVGAQLPDAGPVMAGDFGEILVYLYQGAVEYPDVALGATKWRLKEGRTKPAPYSDVVHFVLPSWPTPSGDDMVLCSEVKTKSTNGTFTPVEDAIEGCRKDRISRLAKTLVWLRERAMTEELGDITIDHLHRFINATDCPPAQKRFRAVAVVAADLLEAELEHTPTEVSMDYTVVVVSVPDLRETYTAVFAAARRAITADGEVTT